jgi:demethoxyubiquinone hydroxylase (CLK1/Coq7/Cat5 family)
MNIEALERKFEKFSSAFLELRKKNDGLEAVNQELRSEIIQLKSEEEKHANQLASFQNQSKIGKIVNELESAGENQLELKSLLDQYIGEIDMCIERLSRH